MAYPLEIQLEIEFHLNRDPVLEEIFFLLYQFRRKVAEAVLGKLAVSCATKIHLGIEHLVPALLARSPGLIFEKLDLVAAVGAFGIEYRVEFPKPWVLSWAFHVLLSLPPVSGWFLQEDANTDARSKE